MGKWRYQRWSLALVGVFIFSWHHLHFVSLILEQPNDDGDRIYSYKAPKSHLRNKGHINTWCLLRTYSFARHFSKHITWINSFNSHHTPIDDKAEAQRVSVSAKIWTQAHVAAEPLLLTPCWMCDFLHHEFGNYESYLKYLSPFEKPTYSTNDWLCTLYSQLPCTFCLNCYLSTSDQ